MEDYVILTTDLGAIHKCPQLFYVVKLICIGLATQRCMVLTTSSLAFSFMYFFNTQHLICYLWMNRMYLSRHTICHHR